MKKWLSLILATVMLLALCACGGTEPENPEEETAEATESDTGLAEAKQAEETSFEGEITDDNGNTVAITGETEVVTEEAEEAEDIVTVITTDGEIEQTNAAELLAVQEENAVRFQSKYIGAQVIVTSTVEKIETDETLFLTDSTYTPDVTVYLAGGWDFGTNDTNEVVAELSRGDTVTAVGTITGLAHFDSEIAVLHTLEYGYTTALVTEAMAAEYEAENPALAAAIEQMMENFYYRDASIFMDYYMNTWPDDPYCEELTQNQDTISVMCYEGTYIRRYEYCWGLANVPTYDTVTAELGGTGYDYYDSSASSHIEDYGSFLRNRGYVYQDENIGIEVNGVTEAYAQFKNADGDIIAMGNGGTFVRVIVYAWTNILENAIEDTTE